MITLSFQYWQILVLAFVTGVALIAFTATIIVLIRQEESKTNSTGPGFGARITRSFIAGADLREGDAVVINEAGQAIPAGGERRLASDVELGLTVTDKIHLHLVGGSVARLDRAWAHRVHAKLGELIAKLPEPPPPTSL